jgi:putative heme-binding domain-containing protein
MHSVVNSLRWGPDGWLYACQGSTVGGDVKRPGDKVGVHSMGQLIWRYHPETRRYEIFAEGGGNAFGCEIDAKGRVYSGHNGGDTRGFHYVQGGYFQKGFSKHGELSNPYSFGYFLPMAHEKVPRFTHNFIIYEGGALPEPYAGKLYGVGPLQSHIVYAEIKPDRSSFQTHDLGHPVTSEDKRFRPVEIKAGPDGGIYIADMYEPMIAHRQHFDGQIDKTTGRVYRLKAKGAVPLKPFDLGNLSTRELIEQLKHKNKWFRQVALRLIADRKDASVVPLLTELVEANSGQFALETLWALNLSGGFNENVAQRTLNHEDPYVRLWTVRLLGDNNNVSPSMAASLAQLARIEKDVLVRSQLASTSKRLAAESGLPIVRNLLAHDEDAADIHVPLLLWWSIESKAESDREAVLALFEDSAVWQLPIVNEHILERVMRRYARAGTRKDLITCAFLFERSPGEAQTKRLMAGFEQAFQGRPITNLPDELVKALAKQGGLSLVLDVRQGRSEAVEKALAVVADEMADKLQRLQFIEIFGEIKEPRSVPALLGIVRTSANNELRQAALAALEQYDEPEIGKSVVALYGDLPADVRSVAQTLLASRPMWTRVLLDAVAAKRIDPATVPLDVVWKIQLHRDEQIAALARQIWGEAKGATSAELQETIERLAVAIRENVGDPYNGKKLFRATCAKCHLLFNDGGKIGPDLTSYKRDDLSNMLLNVVNPSAEIREGFQTYLVITADGRSVTGFLVDRDTQVVVLRGPDGQNVSIPQEQIEEMLPQKKSLMPEELLKPLSDQDVRDLFAYLRSTQPLNE